MRDLLELAALVALGAAVLTKRRRLIEIRYMPAPRPPRMMLMYVR
jgi:hypothetical protein